MDNSSYQFIKYYFHSFDLISHLLCSWIFIARCEKHRALNKYVFPAVQPLKYFVNVKVDEEERSVTTSNFWFDDRKAIFRENLGCTLIVDTSEEDLLKQKVDAVPVVEANPGIPWPEGSSSINNKSGSDKL